MRHRDDMIDNYGTVPEDFVKHLMGTMGIIVVGVLVASILFGVPEKQPLTIKAYASAHPVAFEQVALNALDGQGALASYGPPYNNGDASVQTGIQQAIGVIHPVHANTDFILKPLSMAASLNPAITPALRTFERASTPQQARWESAFGRALAKGVYKNGAVATPKAHDGPLPTLMNATLALGKSGLMSGSLIRNQAIVTRFDNQNYLLFLQGTPLQTNPATQSMLGSNWGIIHPAVNGFPGAWWMTIPTWIYQWSFVANNSAADALALGIGFLFWLVLALIPWIPGLNQVPRYLGVHRLIWKEFYRDHETHPSPTSDEKETPHAS